MQIHDLFLRWIASKKTHGVTLGMMWRRLRFKEKLRVLALCTFWLALSLYPLSLRRAAADYVRKWGRQYEPLSGVVRERDLAGATLKDIFGGLSQRHKTNAVGLRESISS